mmetsp:Transcript_36317/g.115694  ORF Transcript_36317/g.115694 Transcript_36317/m.115694 type:complete len:93 (+) Transcript_36317:751-1029(+)
MGSNLCSDAPQGAAVSMAPAASKCGGGLLQNSPGRKANPARHAIDIKPHVHRLMHSLHHVLRGGGALAGSVKSRSSSSTSSRCQPSRCSCFS